MAGWLQARGVVKGERVAILLENRPQWPMSYFGILLAGAVAVPLDPVSRWDHIHYTLEQTRARIIFTFPKAPLSELQQLPFLERLVVVGRSEDSGEKLTNFQEVLQSSGSEAGLPAPRLQDLASIIYTSGTTGMPKGVMLTHRNFAANCQGIAKLKAIREDDNLLSILPLHHAFPFTGTLLAPLFSRAQITYLDTLKAEAILKCIKEQRVTILMVTPQVLQHFYQGMQAAIAADSLAGASTAAQLSPGFLEGLSSSGGKSGAAAVKEIPPRPGGAVSVFCQWRGQTPRISGGGSGPAGV